MGECEDLLRRSWEGEVLGRHLFTDLCALLPDDRPVWELLAELETTMGELVAPVGRRHGLDIDEAAIERAASDLATAAQGGGRDTLMTSALAVVGEYVPMYERLRELLPEDERWLGDELVTHERAFEAYLRGALEGRPDAGSDIRTFLGRHEARASR